MNGSLTLLGILIVIVVFIFFMLRISALKTDLEIRNSELKYANERIKNIKASNAEAVASYQQAIDQYSEDMKLDAYKLGEVLREIRGSE